MTTLFVLAALSAAYCALYTVFCIKRKKARPIIGAIVLTVLPLAGIALCIMAI